MGERRKRTNESQIARFFGSIEGLPIDTDQETASHAFGEMLQLARTHGLSADDATYLELAMREKLMFATLDRQLKNAAQRIGVMLFS